MPNSLESTWYGSEASAATGLLDRRRMLILAGAAGLLVILRAVLPFWLPCDAMLAHERLAWALQGHTLLDGSYLPAQSWGKQALVGVLEYPPLPTVIVLAVNWLLDRLAALTGVQFPGNLGGRLVVATCQVWLAVYAWRISSLYLRGLSRYLVAALLLLLPVAGPLMLQADPYWIIATLLASCIFHLSRWERKSSLRDVVILALNCGLLAVCGIAGITMAAALILVVWQRGGQIIRGRGGLVLLGMPFIYVLLLYPLFNWLIIEDDPFFMIHRLLPWFSGDLLARLAAQPRITTLATAVTVLAAAGLLARRLPLIVQAGWLLAAAASLVACLRAMSGLYIGGECLLAAYAAIPALLSLVAQKHLVGQTWPQRLPLIAGNLLALFALFTWRQGAKTNESFVDPHPAPHRILAAVDAEWQDSRVLIYDLRAALIYNYVDPKRFPARIDYGPNRLKFEYYVADPAHLGREQFHFLLPPDDGRFYSPRDAQMAGIHDQAHPALMYERGFDQGWQLWRVIRDPSKSQIRSTPADNPDPAP